MNEPKLARPDQMDALHGLRGIAAAAVMIAHFRWYFGPSLIPQAHVAVDLFFTLSGFVLAHAYDSRFAKGMGFFDFAKIRLRRLYPLYFLSLLIGVAGLLALAALGVTEGFSRVKLAVSVATNFLFLPTPPRFSADESLFPLNGPAWSLFWELAINAVFAAVSLHLTRVRMLAMLAVGLAALSFTAWYIGDLSGGSYWHEWPIGGVRVWFSFFLGVYLRRFVFKPDMANTLGSGSLTLIIAIVVASILVRPTAGTTWIFDLFTAALIWPCVILAAARVGMTGRARFAAHLSGEASYGIYVLHIPMIHLLAGLWAFAAGRKITELPAIGVVAIGSTIILSAIIAHYCYDGPVRRWLGARRSVKGPTEGVTQF